MNLVLRLLHPFTLRRVGPADAEVMQAFVVGSLGPCGAPSGIGWAAGRRLGYTAWTLPA